MKILIVEDDPHILLGLRDIVEKEGFEAVVCERGGEAVAAVKAHAPALVVLDVMLPGASGYEICKELRAKHSAVPILMLTAKGREIDKVIGLELGADDYVTKPFGVRELAARIHALLRRAKNPEESATFAIGGAVIDAKRLEIRHGLSVEPLTARELKLLRIFHSHPGEVLSRDRLLNEAWGCNYFGTTRTLGPGDRPASQKACWRPGRAAPDRDRARGRLQARGVSCQASWNRSPAGKDAVGRRGVSRVPDAGHRDIGEVERDESRDVASPPMPKP